MAFQLMALLVVLKLLAVTVSYGTGNAAASSALSVHWRNVGRHRGNRGAPFFPRYTATPGAYALVGMGAVFAGVVRAP